MEQDVIEKSIGSISKLRILKTLVRTEQLLTIYAISKRTRLKREDVKRGLLDLVRVGWVIENKSINNLYSLNKEDVYVKEIINFFLKIGYLD